jgi:hypothetical protein
VQNLLSLHLRSIILLLGQRIPSLGLQVRGELHVSGLWFRILLVIFALHILVLDLTQELAREIHGARGLLLLRNGLHENLPSLR